MVKYYSLRNTALAISFVEVGLEVAYVDSIGARGVLVDLGDVTGAGDYPGNVTLAGQRVTWKDEGV